MQKIHKNVFKANEADYINDAMVVVADDNEWKNTFTTPIVKKKARENL